MSVIYRDSRTGKVSMASLLTIQKNGRTLLFPQMIDVTDAKNIEEIANLIMEHEINFVPEKETRAKKDSRMNVEKYGLKKWNS